jgi:hypothetical protein
VPTRRRVHHAGRDDRERQSMLLAVPTSKAEQALLRVVILDRL